MMIRLSKYLRQYLLIAFLIYLMTILLSFLIYFILIIVEKRFPIIILCAYSIGEIILNGLHLFLIPLQYFLPNLSDDEYYLILVNVIISIFAFVYAYLFYILRPDMFTDIPTIQSTVYSQWLEIQRRRFQETRRAG